MKNRLYFIIGFRFNDFSKHEYFEGISTYGDDGGVELQSSRNGDDTVFFGYYKQAEAVRKELLLGYNDFTWFTAWRETEIELIENEPSNDDRIFLIIRCVGFEMDTIMLLSNFDKKNEFPELGFGVAKFKTYQDAEKGVDILKKDNYSSSFFIMSVDKNVEIPLLD